MIVTVKSSETESKPASGTVMPTAIGFASPFEIPTCFVTLFETGMAYLWVTVREF